MDMSENIDLIIILGVMQILCCVGLLLFGFEKPKKEEVLKPVEFDWKKEGF